MLMTEPLMEDTVPRRIVPETNGWPIWTLSRGKDEVTVLLPTEPVTRTGRTDLKLDLRLGLAESV